MVMVSRMDEGMSSLVLLSVPLFVFLGLLIEMTGMARAMVGVLATAFWLIPEWGLLRTAAEWSGVGAARYVSDSGWATSGSRPGGRRRPTRSCAARS